MPDDATAPARPPHDDVGPTPAPGSPGARPHAPPATAPPTDHAPHPRTPAEYMETPGRHRDSHGAATDVGA